MPEQSQSPRIKTELLANSGRTWSASRRRLASVLIALHVIAVFSAPWSFPPPASDLSRTIAGLFGPYQVGMYINHGYRFFAPDPGASHLVRYEVEHADGTTIDGRFPDRSIWPRLMYHRHFMLSESVFNVENSLNNLETAIKEAQNASQITPEDRQLVAETKKLAVHLRKGIARQLLKQHGGERVRLYLQEHQIPLLGDFLGGMKLDNERLYIELTPLGEFEQGEL